MDSSWSRELQCGPVKAWPPQVNNDEKSLRRAPSRLSATLSCSGQGLVLLPSPFRSFCLSCCILSTGCPQLRSSSVISAAWPQSQDSLTWVAFCLPTLLPKINLIVISSSQSYVHILYIFNQHVCNHMYILVSLLEFYVVCFIFIDIPHVHITVHNPWVQYNGSSKFKRYS